MANPLTYKPANVPADCAFKVSPSKFADFVMKPHNWYRTEVSKEVLFDYSTSSVIGTCVHYCAECIAKDITVDVDAIHEYIDSFEPNENYDPAVVREMYLPMAECLVNDYVLSQDFIGAEVMLHAEFGDKFYAAGTIDALQGHKSDTLVTDYKTYNSKTKPRAIPANYRYQLLVCAFVAAANGYNPTRIRLVYVNRPIDGGISEKTGKPLKSYPPEVTVLTEVITQEDLDFIGSLLELCKDSVLAAQKHPELTHVIFHDPRLRV